MAKPALSFMPATLKLAQEKGLITAPPKPEPNRFERMTLEELLALDLCVLRKEEGMEVALQAMDALTKAANAARKAI